MDGLVFNIQRYSLQDGPGIRTTVFLKGCPLACAWCQNPESRSPEPEVVIVESRCVRCGECSTVCGGLAKEGTETAECSLCGACVRVCPAGARWLLGKRMQVEEVVAEVVMDRVFYEDSGGGATISGGEPLLQGVFVNALLDGCRLRGIHTALDTCGYAPRKDLLETAMRADLVLYDIKMMDEERHRAFTGVSNRLILENLEALSRIHPAIWIRIPVIPGLNDDLGEVERIAEFAASLPGVRQVNLLPYHEGGRYKLARLGLEATLEPMPPPGDEEMERMAMIFRSRGLNTKTGG
jgi:pyruvate formate lyase activating enzyme